MNETRKHDVTQERYLGAEYLLKNPTWDIEDSPWKVLQIINMLQSHGLKPQTIVEVGCGAGAVLAGIREHIPEASLYGFDIAPDAESFWKQHAPADIHFICGDFFRHNTQRYDLLLVLDVIEHLSDPFDFATKLRGYADTFIFHIPLDLSVLSVLREKPLLYVRDKVGHIHYFTRGLALAFLEECGYAIDDWFYTGAAFTVPKRNWRTRLAFLPRLIVNLISKDLGARIMGGETLMVLAHNKEQ